LAGAVLLDYGLKERPLDSAALELPGTRHRLLYPAEDASEVTPEILSGDTPVSFVVLDGSWPKARRMTQRIPALHGMPKVMVGGESQGLSLRKPHGQRRYFTLEAIVRVVEILGPQEEARVLRQALDKLLSRRLHERGKIPRSQVI